MRKTTISVTEAARNFAESAKRARYQNVTFVLLKNGQPVARLVPDAGKTCLGRDLAAALGRAGLSEADAQAWRRDLKAARKVLKAPTDQWL